MPSSADFHTHSTFSDGTLSPTALIEMAYRNGVRVMALTDHDTTEGLPEAFTCAAKLPGFTLVPGIEMSTDIPGNEVHILGYFIDTTDSAFQAALARFQDSRLNRGQKMVEKLRQMGMGITWQRVRELAGEGAVGRPHIAQALLEKGYVTTFNQAFDLYLNRNGPAYVEREKMTPEEVIELLLSVGGLPVAAHPRDLNGLDGLLADWKAAGLVGMEVYYQDYTEAEIGHLKTLAGRHELIPLGGSDYHGLGSSHEREPGNIPLPEEPVRRLFDIAEQRGVAKRIHP